MSQLIRRLSYSSIRHRCYYSTDRIPNYSGWWTSMLQQPTQSKTTTQIDTINSEKTKLPIKQEERQRVVIPFGQAPTEDKPIPIDTKAQSFVELDGKRIPIPVKPTVPDNCCMSGCAHCVWDLYQEDIEEYREKKKELRERLVAANVVVPPELLPKSKQGDATDDLDPTMKAFLALEKKLEKR